MKKDRIIIHADINGHFANSSLIYRPDIRFDPVVVGGDQKSRHGIVLSKNQEAKKYKIPTGCSLHQARQLCPNLMSLPPDYALYTRTSEDFYAFMRQFSDISAPFGCDGMSIDVTDTAHLFGGVENIVNVLHRKFPKEYGLNLSIGISWNFVFAKLASDTAGANGVKYILRESPDDTEWQKTVFPLPVEELLYVGSRTRDKLWNKGERTIGSLVDVGPELLQQWLGKNGLMLYAFATGEYDLPIADMAGGPPMRSIGNGSTTPKDLVTEEQVHNMVHVLASAVCERMRRHRVVPKTIGVSVTYTYDNDLHHQGWQCPMSVPSNLDVEFAEEQLSLLNKRFGMQYPIRKITIGGSNLIFNTSVYQTTLELNAERREKRMKLTECVDEVNYRFDHIISRAVELSDPTLTKLGRKPNQQFAPAGWY